jgi:hypothetical protein
MNEAETCAEYIDPALARAGWGVVEGSRVRREFAIPPRVRPKELWTLTFAAPNAWRDRFAAIPEPDKD